METTNELYASLRLLSDVLHDRVPITKQQEIEYTNEAVENGRPLPKVGEIWEINKYLLREIVSKKVVHCSDEEFDNGWYDIEILNVDNLPWVEYRVCGSDVVYPPINLPKLFYAGVTKESALCWRFLCFSVLFKGLLEAPLRVIGTMLLI